MLICLGLLGQFEITPECLGVLIAGVNVLRVKVVVQTISGLMMVGFSPVLSRV